MLLTAQSSIDEKWASPEFNYRFSNLGLMGSGLQWEIPQELIVFKLTPNG